MPAYLFWRGWHRRSRCRWWRGSWPSRTRHGGLGTAWWAWSVQCSGGLWVPRRRGWTWWPATRLPGGWACPRPHGGTPTPRLATVTAAATSLPHPPLRVCVAGLTVFTRVTRSRPWRGLDPTEAVGLVPVVVVEESSRARRFSDVCHRQADRELIKVFPTFPSRQTKIPFAHRAGWDRFPCRVLIYITT